MNLSNKRDLTIFLSQLARKRRKDLSIPEQVRSILNKYNATMLLPGVSGAMRFGYQPGNYRESTGQTLAGVGQQVGLVVDAARSPGPELVTPFDSGWVQQGTGTVLATGDASFSFTSDGTGLKKTSALVAEKTYRISITSISNCEVWFGLSGASAQKFTSQTNQVVKVLAGNIDLYIRGSITSNGPASVSLSVRELPGIHASQSTSGFQPVLRNTSGIQSWQFDGTDDRLSLSAVPFQMSDDHWVVAGINPSSSANDPAIFSVTSTTNNNPVISLGLLSTGVPRVWWRDDAGTFIQRVSDDNLSVVGSNVVLSGVKSGSTGRFRKNGIPRGSIAVSISAATFNAATVGAFTRSSVTSFLNGPIHGVIFGKGAITDAELLTLEKFMATLQGRTL